MVRKRITLTIVSTLAIVSWAAAEEPVYFVDPQLKAAVEGSLWISDPTPTDMLALTELTCINDGITDLTGLEYAVNLQRLYLRGNPFGSISALSGLSNLESLHLSMNEISDISPLSGLYNLEDLDMHGNEISDISPLSGLTGLRWLVLHRNRVSDISALSGLGNLEHLDLQRNTISDVSALSALNNLTTLILEYNQISDISALSELTSLERLDLRSNPLNQDACDIYVPQIFENNPGIWFKHDFCVWRSMSISSTAGGSVADPGEGDFTYGDGEFVQLTAIADPGFVFIGWAGSYSTAQNPALVLVDQDHRIQATFVRALDVVYVDDDAPDDPGPADGAISDPEENGTPEHPFDQIQEALAVAADGAPVIVRPGIYLENISVRDRSVQLTGIGPDDPKGAAYPIIDGGGTGPVVSFAGSGTSSSTLTGFVITGGKGDIVAALFCETSSPTVRHCLMVGNRATAPDGAAVYCAESEAAFINCTIADNYSGQSGAGLRLVDSSVVVMDSILWGNGTKEILVSGTGDPSITYSCVAGWWPDFGNIHDDPLFALAGHWAASNDPNVVVGPDDPDAVWIEGDYHLQSQAGRWDRTTRTWVRDAATSPCIDAGDPTSPVGYEPPGNGDVINMGAYGGTTQASHGTGVILTED